MKNADRRPSRSILIYLISAVALGLLAVLVGSLPGQQALRPAFRRLLGTDASWLFWVLVALTVACTLPLLWHVLGELSARRLLPSSFERLFSQTTRSNIRRFVFTLSGKAHSLGGRLIAAGAAIFLIVSLVSSSYVMRGNELNSYLYESTSSLLWKKPRNGAAVPIVSFSLFTADNRLTEYLKDCLKIVRDLRSAGAKAVLVDLRNFINRKQNIELLKRLEQTGIVVFGLPYWFNFRLVDSTGVVMFTKARMTMSPNDVWQSPLLSRIRPTGYDYAGDEGMLDVTLELLRKYHDYPKDLGATRDGSDIIFGDYRIPVTTDGWMYSRQPMVRSGIPSLRASAHRGIEADTLRYTAWMGAKGTGHPTNLDDFRDQVMGRIVFLQWIVYGARMEDYVVQHNYLLALQDILGNNVIRKVEYGHPWISLVCLISAGFITYKVRPLASFILIFALGVSVTLLGTYLYDKQNLLIEITYPLLSVVMSMFIFPSITIIEKMRIGEEVVES